MKLYIDKLMYKNAIYENTINKYVHKEKYIKTILSLLPKLLKRITYKGIDCDPDLFQLYQFMTIEQRNTTIVFTSLA